MNKFKTKIYCALGMVSILVFVASCGEKPKDVQDEPATEISEEVDNVQEEIDKNVEENGNAEIGTYVTPDESAFTWEAAEGGVAVTGYTGSDTSIYIPEKLGGETVVQIASGAFSNTQVVGVSCADSVVSLADQAFFYCVTLNEIKMGSAMRQIGNQAFEGCSALSTVVLNDGLETLGENAFGYCVSLKNVELPDTLTSIGAGAFALSGLESVTIPGTVEVVGEEAFSTCAALQTAVLDEGVKALGDYAFAYCDALEKAEIPGSVEELGIRVFTGSTDVTVYGPAGSAIEAYATENEVAFQAQ